MRLLARAAFLLVLVLAPAAAWALPPVWVVHDRDSTMVLFGSVHLLPQGLDWQPHELKQALADADQVWFEAAMDPAAEAQAIQAAAANSELPPDQSLLKMLSRKDRARMANAAMTLGISLDHFDRWRPWYADLIISVELIEKFGGQRAEGVEHQLWNGLSPKAKRIGLETPLEQIGFFADLPQKDQLASLDQTLKGVETVDRDYRVLLDAWMSGDVRTLDREVVQPLRKSAPGLYAKVVQQRNARWTEAIVKRLHGSGVTVVVVGMGHLIGPDGLPARLRARGYDVEGPR